MNTTLTIQNLKCAGCANTIQSKLSNIEGVSNIEINIDASTINFNYINEEHLVDVENQLQRLGYPKIGSTNPISTKAKSFVSCAVGRIKS